MISVIIPAFNEQRALPGTLDRLYAQPGDFEAILADGGSVDATRTIAGRYPGLRITDAPKGRASQMNAGAVEARGEWLLFLHADTLLPENALARIAELPPEVSAGGFRHRFSGEGFGLRLTSLLDNIRCSGSRIVRHTRPQLLDETVVTDSRKFVQQGVWRSLLRVGTILLCVSLGRRLPDFSLRFFEDVR
jgi:glycosyltransferase involved in cell wall biosynthesis